jgi:uncharacterized repeat protein (TIGR03803 family)
MRILDRSALSAAAASALLAGCGASQPSIGAFGAIPNGIRTMSKSYEVLHRFAVKGGNPSAEPFAGLLDVNGTLYGTTSGKSTGNDECGTVFSLSTAGVHKTLYRFHGPDGCIPRSALIDVNGLLYGTTYAGGANQQGAVFSITTSGAETLLYSFKGAPDGANPWAGLVDLNGTLYGTTAEGGNVGGSNCPGSFGDYGCGTVYSITTSGMEAVLYAFKGEPDGFAPLAPLIAVKGKLYGTTTSGGLYWGTVFSITPAGSEKLLYSFTGGTDGNYPFGPLVDVNGTLYGTTDAGGSSHKGDVFSVTLNGSEKVLYTFTGGSDGENPNAGLISVNGTLYSVTDNGGGSACTDGCGTIYSLNPSGSEKVLHAFQGGSDGALPQAALINLKGTFYGTTLSGGGNGCGHGCGTVFTFSQ